MLVSRSLVLAGLFVAGSACWSQLGSLALSHNHEPTSMVPDPTDSRVVYTVGRTGPIRTVRSFEYLPLSENLLDIPPGVVWRTGEGGIHGLAFSPNYARDGFAYLSYTRTGDWAGVVVRLSRSATQPGKLDWSTAFPILTVPNFGFFHNGGSLAFDEDGHLYIGKGDGDALSASQDPALLNGKMLRIDVNRDDFPLDPNRNYGIPMDNPYQSGQPVAGPPEAIHFGLRNPWKFAFDDTRNQGTGAMYVADVGASTAERVYAVAAGRLAENFGWPRWEGTHLFDPTAPLAYEPVTFPVIEYNRTPGFPAAIVGGTVYRGERLGPYFYGRYFYTDVHLRRLLSARVIVDPETFDVTADDITDHTDGIFGDPILGQVFYSLDADAEGELYVVSNVRLFKIVADPPVEHPFATGKIVFGGLESQQDRPPFVTFEIRRNVFEPLTSFQVRLSPEGTFKIPLVPGRNQVSVKAAGWLRRTLTYNTDTLAPQSLDFDLIQGDLNDDNSVDIGDFVILGMYFGRATGPEVLNRRADINRNGDVDIGDFALFSQSFGLDGDD